MWYLLHPETQKLEPPYSRQYDKQHNRVELFNTFHLNIISFPTQQTSFLFF